MPPITETPEVPDSPPKATDAAAAPPAPPVAPAAKVAPDPAAKSTPTVTLTTDQALEKELRRYVKQGGMAVSGKMIKPDFRKNLAPEQIARAKVILKHFGRRQPAWDVDLLPV